VTHLRGGGNESFTFFGKPYIGNAEEGKKRLGSPVGILDSYCVGRPVKATATTWKELCGNIERRSRSLKGIERKQMESKEAKLREEAELLKGLAGWAKEHFSTAKNTLG
jgi:hypothetical protein